MIFRNVLCPGYKMKLCDIKVKMFQDASNGSEHYFCQETRERLKVYSCWQHWSNDNVIQNNACPCYLINLAKPYTKQKRKDCLSLLPYVFPFLSLLYVCCLLSTSSLASSSPISMQFSFFPVFSCLLCVYNKKINPSFDEGSASVFPWTQCPDLVFKTIFFGPVMKKYLKFKHNAHLTQCSGAVFEFRHCVQIYVVCLCVISVFEKATQTLCSNFSCIVYEFRHYARIQVLFFGVISVF